MQEKCFLLVIQRYQEMTGQVYFHRHILTIQNGPRSELPEVRNETLPFKRPFFIDFFLDRHVTKSLS